MSEAQATPDAGDNEIERLRERVTFYESFDRLIQENIARSGDLLRQAVEMRENAEREMAQARATATRDLTAERERYRRTLSGLLGEVTRLQQHVGRLEQRLSETLDTLDGEHPSEPSTPSAPPAVPEPAATAESVPPSTSEAKPAELAPAPAAAVAATATIAPAEQEQSQSAAPVAPTPVVPEPEPKPGSVAAEAETTETVPSAEAAVAEPESGPRAVTVLVHGVPRAATALSLQRHLARLEPVEGVEAREYAEGILRLQVMTHRPLRPDDLGGWEGGAGLTPLNVLDDVLEVRLPGAEGL